jgi:cysteine synthase
MDGSVANFESLARRVGNTPLVELPGKPNSPVRLLVKLEGTNPTGSVKDRACVGIFKAMLEDPDWNSSKILLDASSGNMGCSIAYFGRALGVSVRIVSSSKLTDEKKLFIEYFGGTVETVGNFTIDGNVYCRDIAALDPERWHFLDQLHNPANPAAHCAEAGPEILSQAPEVAAVVGSIGSGGTLLGVGRYLKQVNDKIGIFAIEAASGTRLPGTAALIDGDYRTPFIEEGFKKNIFDGSIHISESEAVRVAREISATGLFVGLQTCAVIAGAWRTVETRGLQGDVVVISGDTGWKNMNALGSKVLGHTR